MGSLPLSRFLYAASIIAYGAYLLVPAVHGGNTSYSGATLLGLGWMGLLFGVPTWLANPLYFAALLTHRARGLSMTIALFAWLFAMHFIWVFHTVLLDEAGAAHIDALAVGYYLWNASLLCLAINRALRLTRHKSTLR